MSIVRCLRELFKAGLALCVAFSLAACSEGYSAKVGEAAPEIGAIDLNGNTVKIADFRGHVAILNFWQGGCAPCLTEMPIIQRVYEKHRKNGVRVLSVNIGGGRHIVKDTIEETKVTYDVAVDELFIASTRYNVMFFPTTYIIDRKGVIRERLFGEVQQSTLEEKIAPLL